MKLNTIMLLAASAIGFSNAACNIQGFSGSNCSGSKGDLREITSGGRCVQFTGRRSYRISGDCPHIRVEKFEGTTTCSNNAYSLNDTSGESCRNINDPGKKQVASMYVRRV